MKHLKEKQIGYWKHWWVATRAGFGLLIHAWVPDLLPNYAMDSNLIKQMNLLRC
jgi:hypothetical protein